MKNYVGSNRGNPVLLVDPDGRAPSSGGPPVKDDSGVLEIVYAVQDAYESASNSISSFFGGVKDQVVRGYHRTNEDISNWVEEGDAVSTGDDKGSQNGGDMLMTEGQGKKSTIGGTQANSASSIISVDEFLSLPGTDAASRSWTATEKTVNHLVRAIEKGGKALEKGKQFIEAEGPEKSNDTIYNGPGDYPNNPNQTKVTVQERENVHEQN